MSSLEASSPSASPSPRSHLYGGQAVVEGVMMRGERHWALAVRKHSGDIHLESHDIRSAAEHRKWLRKPLIRGVVVLGQSISIGIRALMISANQSADEDLELTKGQVGMALALAITAFVGIFILGPALLFGWVSRKGGHGLAYNVGEGVFRVALFVGYIAVIGMTKDVRRVFQYHGAEHKVIAAYESETTLDPEAINRFPKEHVRCGTNFLIIVMVITIFVFTLVPTPTILARLASRIVVIPVIAAISYEALRLGSKFPGSKVMRGLMAPGIWLQKITTRQPDASQIEVAIASFGEVRRRETEDAASGH